MYYVMMGPVDQDHAVLGYEQTLERDWRTGKRFKQPPSTPLPIEADPDFPGTLPEFTEEPLPLMTNRLLDILRKTGANNLDTYPAVIRFPAQNKTFDNYAAVNIVGTIARADLKRFRKKYAGNELVLRLKEAPNPIVIHANVKKHIEAAGIGTISFVLPDQIPGAGC